jgi:hypothetical protein
MYDKIFWKIDSREGEERALNWKRSSYPYLNSNFLVALIDENDKWRKRPYSILKVLKEKKKPLR